jgi:hypothetical protein
MIQRKNLVNFFPYGKSLIELYIFSLPIHAASVLTLFQYDTYLGLHTLHPVPFICPQTSITLF